MANNQISQQPRTARNYSCDGMLAPPRRFGTYANDRWRRRTEKAQVAVEHIDKIEEEIEQVQTQLNHETRTHRSDVEKYEGSTSTQQTLTNDAADTKVAEFFGLGVVQLVLQNATAAHQLRKYARSRHCKENLEFLEMLDQYHQSVKQVSKMALDIQRKYTSVKASSQVNLTEDARIQIDKNIKSLLGTTMPSVESIFASAQKDIESLVVTEIYPGFVRQQMAKNATAALATNRSKYAGLGDCFVLTDPNKPDNPIVYASDGFVNVTGYGREEIISRNCRFLQGTTTNRKSVTRIRQSLETRSEHVELILNFRRNGDPFWNLLYTVPLYDASQNLMFFLGGQVNVSTAVHNTSDVLQILSHSDDDLNEEQSATISSKKSKASLFTVLRKKDTKVMQAPGMGNDLLNDFNTMSYPDQKAALSSAYSKYIIVNAETMSVDFCSSATLDLLFPVKPTGRVPEMTGEGVFDFLSNHSPKALPRGYKSSVRSAVKSGKAISLDLRLCTRRTMSFEQFLTHWTPLKDNEGHVVFVVLTIGNLRDVKDLK